MSSMFGSDDEEDEEVRLDSNGVMAFHKGTEDAMFIYLENHGATSTSECLDIIDTFANKRHWMMHMGPEKREILQDAVTLIPNWTKKDQPLLILELGSYCGYSTSFLASLLADRDGSTSTRSMIVSVEPEAEAVRWTQRLVGICGLKDISVVLQTVVSTLDSSDVHDDFVQKVNGLDFGEKGQKPLFDMVFIDHDKTKYLTDLRLLLQQGLLKPGCVVVADNVHSFDQPLTEYLDFVRSDSRFLRSELRPARVEYSSVQQVPASKSGSYFFDAVEISALRG